MRKQSLFQDDRAAVIEALQTNEALRHVHPRRAIQDPGEYRVHIEEIPGDAV